MNNEEGLRIPMSLGEIREDHDKSKFNIIIYQKMISVRLSTRSLTRI